MLNHMFTKLNEVVEAEVANISNTVKDVIMDFVALDRLEVAPTTIVHVCPHVRLI